MNPLLRLIIGILLAAILTAGGYLAIWGAVKPEPEFSNYGPDCEMKPGQIDCIPDNPKRGEEKLPERIATDGTPYRPRQGPGPHLIVRIQPIYPQSELNARREGDVTLNFSVTTDGTVRDIIVKEATNDAFAEAVINAVAQWRYTPKMLDKKPVETKDKRVTALFRIRAICDQDTPGPDCGIVRLLGLSAPDAAPPEKGPPPRITVTAPRVPGLEKDDLVPPPEEPMPIFDGCRMSYPREEAKAGREGSVTLEFTIHPNGSVTDITIIEATNDAFADAVKRGVASGCFRRMRREMPVRKQITIDFTLDEE